MRVRAFPATALLFLSASAAVAAPGAAVRWRDIGPERGVVPGLDGILVNPLDPDQLLAPSRVSVFKSSDAGASWRPARAGLLQASGAPALVANLRRAPGRPLTVYGTSEDGLFRSTDFGEGWTALAPLDLDDVAPDPADPARLLAVGVDYDTGSSRLLLSTDGGASFAAVEGSGLPGPLDFAEFTNLAFSPGDPATVFVAESYSGLWRSTDGGATFALVDSTSFLHPLQVFPLPSRPEVVFLQAALTATGLMRSDDGGATFVEVLGGLPAPGFFRGVQFVAFDPRDDRSVYAASPSGAYHSSDGGNTFAPLGLTAAQLGPPAYGGAITLTVDPVRRRTLYVNTPLGNFKSVDGGRSFRGASSGFRATTVTGFAQAGREGEPLYVVADSMLLRGDDGGEGYQQVLLPDGAYPRVVAVSPRSPGTLYVTLEGSGFLRSTDGGLTWKAPSGDASSLGGRIFVDPRAPDDVFVFYAGLWRSADAGATFTAVADSSNPLLAFDPIRPGVVYAGGGRGFDLPLLLKSSDAGATFAGTLPGLGYATALAVSRDGVVYVGGLVQQDLTKPYPSFDVANSLVRSGDGGATFAAADVGLSGRDVSWIGIEAGRAGRLFAYSRGGYNPAYQGDGTTLYLSTDGASWSVLDPLAGTFPAQVFAVDPEVRGRIYLGGASLLAVDVP